MLKGVENKKRIELTLTGIGVIILIFLLANSILKPKANKTVTGSGDNPASEGSIVSFTNSEPRATPVRRSLGEGGSDAKWRRDPFLLEATVVKEEGVDNLTLNGVISDSANSYAIINNDVVKLGDKVNGMTVVEIREKSVVLDENGQKHTLELNVY
ncbi:MAG: hypothetical protein Q8O12_00385 [Candidatus Omnitrophota bacterium]|nr:hypothetical protein [Candidatus Omnitrophota bacterium]